ncbi:hypothetical protein MKZ38_000186 [Zalerion maritima]|uniref:C2H2-type domain-containing protein n=1 Tax=Zalerion maritima TaxID=339359 RepID=A0AAD5RFQ2_9PEZI|nr:hypothetical protein MKZ38_000186 [Zalerion maritima]
MALVFATHLGDRNRLHGAIHRSRDQESPGVKVWLSRDLASDHARNSPRPDLVIPQTPTQKTRNLPRLDEAIHEIDLSKTTLPPIAANSRTCSNTHGSGRAVLERDTTLYYAPLPQPLPRLPPARTDCDALIAPDDSCSSTILRPTLVHETPAATVPTVTSLSRSLEPPSSNVTDVEELTAGRDTPTTARQTSSGKVTRGRPNTFICNFPGCIARPFQTRYLLESHAYVRSSDRPFYCSVGGCTRGEAGKGFKRKNEMVRHGLVHDSSGYTCPFCQKHKYPRPDSLQRQVSNYFTLKSGAIVQSLTLAGHRHVRIHHPEQDENDPQLRRILLQKTGRRSHRKRCIKPVS